MSEKTSKCDRCSKVFSGSGQRGALANHIKAQVCFDASERTMWVCKGCTSHYTSRAGVEKHIQEAHEGQTVKYTTATGNELSDVVAKLKVKLGNNIMKSSPLKDFPCPVSGCNVVYHSASGVRRHVREQHPSSTPSKYTTTMSKKQGKVNKVVSKVASRLTSVLNALDPESDQYKYYEHLLEPTSGNIQWHRIEQIEEAPPQKLLELPERYWANFGTSVGAYSADDHKAAVSKELEAINQQLHELKQYLGVDKATLLEKTVMGEEKEGEEGKKEDENEEEDDENENDEDDENDEDSDDEDEESDDNKEEESDDADEEEEESDDADEEEEEADSGNDEYEEMEDDDKGEEEDKKYRAEFVYKRLVRRKLEYETMMKEVDVNEDAEKYGERNMPSEEDFVALQKKIWH